MKQSRYLKSLLAGLLIVCVSASSLPAAGVTVVTHGNQPSEEVPEWLEYMVNAVGAETIPGSWSRYTIFIDDPGWNSLRATVVHSGTSPSNTDSGEIVIELDWSEVAGGLLIPDYPTADIAEKIAECLTAPDFFPGLTGPAVELPIHLAGHSRGGVLMAQLAELLGRNGIWINQVTTLDPVPMSKDTLAGTFPMRLKENVIFADNYIQTLTPFVPGSRLEGSYPRSAWDDSTDLSGGYSMAHSDVHLWYHGTIDLNTPTTDGAGSEAQTITSAMRSSTGWWNNAEEEGELAGFYYSRILGGTYDGGTRSEAGYTPPTNPFREPWTITATGADVWDNVEIAAVEADEVLYPGDSIQVNTWFYDLNNDATITWGLDPGNQNPYKNTARIELASIETSSVPFGTGESLTTARYVSQTLDTTGVPPVSYCVYAKISNDTRTRYYYHNCNDSGTLNVECNNNAQCDDGLFCTGSETCADGTCMSTGDPCTTGPFTICTEANDSCVECSSNDDCNDGLYCSGVETCADGTCISTGDPCAAGPFPICDEAGDSCFNCSSNNECNDGLYCSGVETCADGTCMSTGDPCATDPFTICDEVGDSCVECLEQENCPNGYRCINAVCVPSGFMQIDKSSVKAGKTAGRDSIKLSGLLDTDEGDFVAAIGGSVTVTIESDYIPDPDATTYTFLIDKDYVRKGKYKSPKIKPSYKNAPVTLFACDTNKGTMQFSAKNVDLTGVSCPITLKVQIGDYVATVEMNEDIVNGTKKPCPLPFMMGVYASLDATKVKAKKSSKTDSDSVSISGTFTINGSFDIDQPLIIELGSDTFTVPDAQFVFNKGSYSCKSYDSGNGLVTAKFDTIKCTYSIKIKNATLSDSGDVDFGLYVFDNPLQASGQIPLPPNP